VKCHRVEFLVYSLYLVEGRTAGHEGYGTDPRVFRIEQRVFVVVEEILNRELLVFCCGRITGEFNSHYAERQKQILAGISFLMVALFLHKTVCSKQGYE